MSERDRAADRDELETLLPFYLNGTLEGDELRRVEEWLAGDDPEAIAALAQAEAEFAATLEANEALRPPADALSRFAVALEREAGSEPKSTEQPSPLMRFWYRIVGLPAGVAWAAAGLAVAVLLFQAIVDRGAPERYEVASEGQTADDLPFVLVAFDPEASMGEITDALSGFGVSVSAGPLPGGMYRISIPVTETDEFDRISADMTASDLVEQVVIGRGPADGP